MPQTKVYSGKLNKYTYNPYAYPPNGNYQRRHKQNVKRRKVRKTARISRRINRKVK